MGDKIPKDFMSKLADIQEAADIISSFDETDLVIIAHIIKYAAHIDKLVNECDEDNPTEAQMINIWNLLCPKGVMKWFVANKITTEEVLERHKRGVGITTPL
jgi:hypothetical protein